MRQAGYGSVCAALLLLGACSGAESAQDNEARNAEDQERKAGAEDSARPSERGDTARITDGDPSDSGTSPELPASEEGTPLEDRTATLGLLNKRNNVSQDVTLQPGQVERVGNVELKLSSCERTAPWELPQETGAFVQVRVRETGQNQWDRVFSGWLFKNSPSLNVVEHPIYDVWVKDCAMTFPGEEPRAAAVSQSES